MKRKATKSEFEYGLKPQECAALRDALAASPRVERAVLFGSRATGTFSPASDVDLALYGDGVTLADQADLASRIEDLNLPVPVDLLRIATIDSDALRKHIEQHGKLFYQKGATNRASKEKSVGMGSRTRLSELCEQIVDCPHSTPMWTDYGAIVLRSQNIRNGRLDLSAPSYTDDAHFQARTRRAVPTEGDLVITREAPMGEVCIIPPGLQCCLGQRMVLLRPNRAKVDSRYLLFALQSNSVRHEIFVNEGTGSTVSNLRIPLLEALPIPTPSLLEQRAIAHILGTLDDKIELNRKMNETLEAMARALFQSWFVDFDPVRAKAEGRDPGLPADIAALFPDSFEPSELGEIPKGWSVTNVYEIADVIYGAPFASTHFNSKGIGRPLIRIRDLKDESPEVYTPEIHPKGHTVNQGDIVVGMDGEFRAYIWGGVQAWLNQRVCVFKPKHGSSAAFVVNSIFKPLALVEATETATTVIHLGKSDIDQFKILFPTQDLLEACAKICQPMYDRIVEIKRESRTLASLRDTLLPKLISGELRVKDAAHPVEAAI